MEGVLLVVVVVVVVEGLGRGLVVGQPGCW